MKQLKQQRLTILWSVLVLVLCNMPMGSVSESPMFFPGFDKLVHCGFFFVFVVLAINGYVRAGHTLDIKSALALFFISVAFGGAVELLQLYVFTWRDGNWADLFADAVGAGMATFSILVTYYAVKK
ncbi:VanZ family protein [Mucilaginibacter sp. RS28]|uniref:VanZ family protein n=1 Tax=Mucilaginibacter straminoryzae TaxID=2932774 RepID=A0A9X2B9Y9_9SPHI|nr:VanZ family protein [Mucilaginibacter straminoryzae]MCJ8208217.1 VanZ family protein [Mucilaginibacter straminoryzae]